MYTKHLCDSECVQSPHGTCECQARFESPVLTQSCNTLAVSMSTHSVTWCSSSFSSTPTDVGQCSALHNQSLENAKRQWLLKDAYRPNVDFKFLPNQEYKIPASWSTPGTSIPTLPIPPIHQLLARTIAFYKCITKHVYYWLYFAR